MLALSSHARRSPRARCAWSRPRPRKRSGPRARSQASPRASPPPAPAPDSGFRPGFVDAVGHWLNEGTTRFKSDLQGAQATFDQLGKETRDAAKGATDAVVGLPNARIVTVRERCAVAQNGAPD